MLVTQSRAEYLGAWRLVNDIQSELGADKFNSFLNDVEYIFTDYKNVEVHCFTRAWIVKK